MNPIYDLARDWLESIETVYAAEGVELPERRYVHSGFIADDCEQFVVSGTQVFPGMSPFDAQQAQRAVRAEGRSALLAARLIRCVPVPDAKGHPPTALALEDSAADLLLDAYLIYVGTLRELGAGNLWDGCTTYTVLSHLAVPPSADLGGWEMQAQVQF